MADTKAELEVQVFDKTICYEGFFRIERYHLRHRLFNGDWGRPIIRELFERGHAAAVLPYDPVRDEVVLIEQFRIGAMGTLKRPWLLEIVAGIIEENESAEDVVRRESVEEAGCEMADLIPVYEYLVSPGGTTEQTALFCGRVDAAHVGGVHGAKEEGEDIKVHVVSLQAAMQLLESGKITSASAVIALQWLVLNRNRVRSRWLGE